MHKVITQIHNDTLFQSEQIIFTVSELSYVLKYHIENKFKNIQVRGEISGLNIASSGHIYFDLKDNGALIKVTCWRNVKLDFNLENGMDVICIGSLTIYKERSNYQINLSNVKFAGVGALLMLIERRKKELEQDGCFRNDKKKPIPFLPQTLGVITSLQGAVVRDIIQRISKRFPIHVFLWDVPVQGKESAAKIVSAINGFNHSSIQVEVIIIARGGGSIEDLLSFNDSEVVRAIYKSKIPIITAIGHETDVSLADLASDIRASTPTAAAELAVPVLHELSGLIGKIVANIISTSNVAIMKRYAIVNALHSPLIRVTKRFDNEKIKIKFVYNKIFELIAFFIQRMLKLIEKNSLIIVAHHLNHNLELRRLKLTQIMHNIKYLILYNLERLKNRIMNAITIIQSYDYKKTLNRGFCVVRSIINSQITHNKVILNGHDLICDTIVELEFRDCSRIMKILT